LKGGGKNEKADSERQKVSQEVGVAVLKIQTH
jgi:hypothetical protein